MACAVAAVCCSRCVAGVGVYPLHDSSGIGPGNCFGSPFHTFGGVQNVTELSVGNGNRSCAWCNLPTDGMLDATSKSAKGQSGKQTHRSQSVVIPCAAISCEPFTVEPMADITTVPQEPGRWTAPFYVEPLPA